MVVGSVMETVQEDTEQKVEAAHRDAASQQLADLLGASFNLVRWGSSPASRQRIMHTRAHEGGGVCGFYCFD